MRTALETKHKRHTLYLTNYTIASKHHLVLRDIRGDLSQYTVAALADVCQPYISRVESGYPNGIGADALNRILDVYKELAADGNYQYRGGCIFRPEDSEEDVTRS